MQEKILKQFVNRVVDGIYLSSVELKISFEDFTKIISKVEDIAFIEIYKNYATHPYIKKSYLEPVLIDDHNEIDIKEYMQRLSMTLRDVLIMIESHRDYISRVKESRSNNIEFLKNYKKSFNDVAAVLISYNDILLEMLEQSSDDEMNEVLKRYFSENSSN